MIRAATPDDLVLLPEIEREAGELFRPLQMDLVADDEPPTPAQLEPFRAAGRAWVAQYDDEIAGYLVAEPVDGCEHIEQVTVRPRFARRGIGAGLIDHLASWAMRRGTPALTLTTFREVPWNGPYYLTRGFYWLSNAELTPGLQRLREAERERGLDTWPRGCMRRDLIQH